MKTWKQVLECSPKLSHIVGSVRDSRRLGGLTNENILLISDLGQFVLRIAGPGTEAYINRSFEKHAAMITSELKVNAPILYFDERSGVQLSEFLANATTMNEQAFKDLGCVQRAAVSLRRVHESGALFLNRFELFAMVDSYLEVLKLKNASLPQGFYDVKQEAESVRAALNKHPLPVVPCHCDPLAENFLDDGSRSYVIDWEYSGNNDPMWDLADVCVEARFDEKQEEVFLSSYFSAKPATRCDISRVVLYKAMCDFLWTLWGLIQHVNNNPADDFLSYSENRFRRCKVLMETSEFGRHLSIVADS